jgi:hypothetical protein
MKARATLAGLVLLAGLGGSVATFKWRHTRGTMPASHQIAIWNNPAMKWSWRTI